ncbi:phosphoadenosine phosphosulfate reductase family protein [Flavisolibacter sp. BT320]|nr:phosphoadenosine phosphosulfate reductase family protein [Flavisolibacter longurius]
MNKKLRHVLGISGGKDSAALAIYLFQKYPQLDIEYYTCDTGKELDETYQLIDNLEIYLGKKIKRLVGAPNSHIDPFDHFLKLYGGYLPSSNSRWCTRKLKLEPFEAYVGDDPVVSYVGIRGDEDRVGYISRKSNIQSIFPFRKNIWSEDVINKFLANINRDLVIALTEKVDLGSRRDVLTNILTKLVDTSFSQSAKLNRLLDAGTKETNYLIFEYLKTTAYPLAQEQYFPLLENEDVLVREDIFQILRDSGVGVPAYYEKKGFEVEGNKGHYARSRSGCFFCFFQQKIEWVWLHEQHPEKFRKAMEYEDENAGFTWNQNESLKELMKPDRIKRIKEDYLKRNKTQTKTTYLLDILDDSETEGCATCFI